MGTITVFRNVFSSEKEEYTFSEGQRIKDVVSFDEERSHVWVNGFLKNGDFTLSNGDVCLVREYSGMSLTGAVVLFAVIITASVVDYYTKAFTGKGLFDRGRDLLLEYLGLNDEAEMQDPNQVAKIPQLRGARNQSWASKPVPLVLGEHLFTPGYCGLPYTQIDPTTDPDGEKQFVTMLFMLGYSPLIPTDIRIGEILAASNSANTLNGFITIDGAYSASEYGMQIEVRDSAEVSLYPQKVVEDAFNIELLNAEGVGPGYPIRFSAANTMKLQVEIFFNGLFRLNDDGERRTATVEVRAQWRPLNGDDSQWTDFPAFVNATSFSGGVNTFTRSEAKQMRFISTKEFTYAEMSAIPTGIVEVRLFRNNTKSTSMRTNDSVSWTATRSWCFDKEKSSDLATLVPQVPVVQKLREKTVRLALRVYAKDDLTGVLNSINMVLKAITRTWNGSAWSTKSASYTGKTTSRNPAAVALSVLQGNNLGKNAYNDSELDMAEFGRFYDFCQTKGFTCNGVITNDQSLDTVLTAVLFTGRAQKIIKDGLYSLFVDKPQSTPITILNNQNVISASNTKEFERIPDGIRITFVDEYDRYQMNEMYVMADGKSSSDPDSEFLDLDLTYITNRNHVWKIGRYILACLMLRPEVWTRKVSIEGIGMPIGSLISVQDDTIVVGLNSGGEIKNLIMDGSSIIGIETDSYFDMVDGTLYGVKILQADGISDPTIRTIHIQTEPGTHNQLYFIDSIADTEEIKPSVGDIVAFGVRDLITADAIVTGSVSSDNGQYELTLVPYDPGVYIADEGEIPPFDSKITKPQNGLLPQQIPTIPVSLAEVGELIDPIVTGTADLFPDDIIIVTAVARQDYIDMSWAWDGSALKNSIKRFIVEVSKDSGTTWTPMYATGNRIPYYFNRSVDGYPEKNTGAMRLDAWRVRVKAENIYENTSLGYGPSSAGQILDLSGYLTWGPKAPYGITAKAEEAGILVSWKADESDYYGSNKTFSIKLNGTTELSGIQGRSILVPFNRSTHGYPEKVSAGGTLDTYQVVVSAHTAEKAIGTAAAAVTPDVSGYLTWIPAVPSISGKASGRSVSLEFTPVVQCYGFKSFDIQIQRSGVGSWYAIGDSALAWTDEESYRSGAVNTSTATPFNQLAQTVPLSGQAGDLPVDTDYLYRARMSIQKGASVVSSSYSSAITVKARATATKDIVSGAVKNAQLAAEAVTYDKIAARTVQAENLHALAANLVNTLVREPNRTLTGGDFPQGWNKGTVGGAASISTTSRGQSLYLTVTAAGQGISSDVFNVAPDEILEITFLIYRSTAGNGSVTLRADASAAPTSGIARWVWDDTLKTWVSASAIYTLIDAAVTSAAWRSFKTYILGCDVDIADVPSPAPGSLGNTISCVRVAASRNTAQLVFLFGEASGTIIIAAPCASSMAGGKVIASQVTVKNLSAINSKLGEINGDTADYKLVMGSGGSAEEGTFLLGSTSDASYFRRWKEGGVWKLAMKLATFFVDAVTSKILGKFQVRTAADTATSFEVDPGTGKASLFGNDLETWIRRGVADAQSTNTGSGSNLFGTLIRVQIPSRYQQYDASFRYLITGHGGGPTGSGTINVRVKQQADFGADPVIMMNEIRDTGGYTALIFFYYKIVQNSVPTTVDIIVKIVQTYTNVNLYCVSASKPEFATLYNSLSLTSTEPTGLVPFAKYHGLAVGEVDGALTDTTVANVIPDGNINRDFGSLSRTWANGYFRYLRSPAGIIIASYDSWLRLNDGNQHASGIYCGTRKLRTDGMFQIGGDNAERFRVNEDGRVQVGNGSTALVVTPHGSISSLLPYNKNRPAQIGSIRNKFSNISATNAYVSNMYVRQGFINPVLTPAHIVPSAWQNASASLHATDPFGSEVILVYIRLLASNTLSYVKFNLDTMTFGTPVTLASNVPSSIHFYTAMNGISYALNNLTMYRFYKGEYLGSTSLSLGSITPCFLFEDCEGTLHLIYHISLVYAEALLDYRTNTWSVGQSIPSINTVIFSGLSRHIPVTTADGSTYIFAKTSGGANAVLVYKDGVFTITYASLPSGVSFDPGFAHTINDDLIELYCGVSVVTVDISTSPFNFTLIGTIISPFSNIVNWKNKTYLLQSYLISVEKNNKGYVRAGAGIIESGTSADGKTHYTLFSDGTLICRGNNVGVINSYCLITFPYAFADSDYALSAVKGGNGSTGTTGNAVPMVPEGFRTATTMRVYLNIGSNYYTDLFSWMAIGRAAT